MPSKRQIDELCARLGGPSFHEVASHACRLTSALAYAVGHLRALAGDPGVDEMAARNARNAADDAERIRDGHEPLDVIPY